MSTDVLLINPPWVSKDENIWNGIKGAMPPLGLLTIAAYLEQKGVSVSVIDIHVEKLGEQQLQDRIKAIEPRVVGITVLTSTALASYKIATLVKAVVPGALVVVGGAHVDALPADALRNRAIDIVVHGDGEITFWKIVNGDARNTIHGISYREGRQLVRTPPAEVVMDLDRLPFPAYHLVPMRKYYPTIGAYKRLPAINIMMTRGCPGKCTFCCSAGTKLRKHSAARVVDEIIRLKKEYGIRELQFYDDTFTIFKKNVFEFCELMSARAVNVTWSAFARVDCFSKEMAVAMKKAGCHQVMFGVESGDEQIRRNINKPIDEELTRRSIRDARAAGLEVRAAFMLGSEGETVETMEKTLWFSRDIDPDIAVFNITTPYPGTRMFNWARQHGYLKTEDWSEYELSDCIMRLPTVSEKEILQYYARAYREFYRRPKIMMRKLMRIRNIHHIKDSLCAFFYIVLRHKMGARGAVRQDWVNLRREDFFRIDLIEGESMHADHCVVPERPPQHTEKEP